MTQSLTRRRRPHGRYPKKVAPNSSRAKQLPEYLEAQEVRALIEAADIAPARLLMLVQWRAGLRISEALALRADDLSLDSDMPTLRVRSGKGNKSRIVPVHPELRAAFVLVLSYANPGEGRIIDVHRSTAWRWIQKAAARAEARGALPRRRKLGTHTLRHSYARHLLMHGVPINFLSRWLGHSSIQTTLVYLELLPDPAGSLAGIP